MVDIAVEDIEDRLRPNAKSLTRARLVGTFDDLRFR